MKQTILRFLIITVIFAMCGAAVIVFAGEDTLNRPFGVWLTWKVGAMAVMVCAFLLGRWAYRHDLLSDNLINENTEDDEYFE